jgi:hypothetical protein
VAQHDQLDVLDLRRPAASDQQLQQRYEDEVDEGEEHRAMLPEPVRGWRLGPIRVLAPFTHSGVRSWVGPLLDNVGHPQRDHIWSMSYRANLDTGLTGRRGLAGLVDRQRSFHAGHPVSGLRAVELVGARRQLFQRHRL